MSNIRDEILHKLLDVAASRVNIPPHEADKYHEALEPGYTDVPLSDAEQAQFDAWQARQARLAADQAAREAPADPGPAPVAHLGL